MDDDALRIEPAPGLVILISAEAIVACAESGRLDLALPESTLAKLVELADREGCEVDELVLDAINTALNRVAMH